jgi:hypothetical protein
MKNIKTFGQLFESSPNDGRLKIVSFGPGEFKEFSKYCIDAGLSNWDAVKWEPAYDSYTKSFGKFYIINDSFLVMCKGETPSEMKIISGSDSLNRFYSKPEEIDKLIIKKIGCHPEILKMSLSIARKISPFTINKNFKSGSDNEIDFLCDYFKNHPLEIYALDGSPELKKEVLDKTGIRDYSNIGRKLRSGMI